MTPSSALLRLRDVAFAPPGAPLACRMVAQVYPWSPTEGRPVERGCELARDTIRRMPIQDQVSMLRRVFVRAPEPEALVAWRDFGWRSAPDPARAAAEHEAL